MHVYLVRHGDAVPASENPQRPLSVTGRERVTRLAKAAVQRGAQPALIWHSGILRAVETAEILAGHWSSAIRIVGVSGLLPEDDPAIVAAEIEATEAAMLVGHLPFLTRLSALLLHGDPSRSAVEFAPASMVCLARTAADWKISWQITP